MALEDRIRSSADQALQGLIADVLIIHSEESSRLANEADARVRESEQRLQADFDQRLAEMHAAQQSATDAAVQAALEEERARIHADTEQRFAAEVDAAARAASVAMLAEAEQRFEEQLRSLDDERRAAVADAEARGAEAALATLDATRAAEAAGLVRLVESIRGLDGAASLSEVLDALALAAAKETARAAVLVVKGDHVVGWRVAGFGARDAQPKSIDLPITDAGVIGLAATSSRVATTRNGAADGPGFEELLPDYTGLAMPVLVGGRVVAVVYADGIIADGGSPEQATGPWPEAIEVLARHAGRCLEALTAQKVNAPAPAARRLSTVPAAEGAVGAAG